MFLLKKQLLLAKEEATYGVDPSPTVGSNAILVMEPQVKENFEEIERNPSAKDIGQMASVNGARTTEITFKVELRGSSAAGSAPEIGDLLEACGMAETVTAGSSVVYSPVSVNDKSVTIYHYAMDNAGSAVLKKLTGARGTFKLTAEAGKLAYIEFTFTGKYNAPTDVAAPGDPTYQSVTPQKVASQTLSLNADTGLIVQSVAIDMGNEVSVGPSISGVYGVNDIQIISRKPTIELNPEQVLVADYDFRTDWLTTPRAFSMDIGTGTGKVTITAPALNILEMTPGDKEGRTVEEIKAQLAKSSGNDEIAFKFE